MEGDHLILDRVLERDRRFVTRAVAGRKPGERRAKRQHAAVGQRERLEVDVDETVDVADIGVRNGNDAKVPRRAGGSENSSAHGQIALQMHFDHLARV